MATRYALVEPMERGQASFVLKVEEPTPAKALVELTKEIRRRRVTLIGVSDSEELLLSGYSLPRGQHNGQPWLRSASIRDS